MELPLAIATESSPPLRSAQDDEEFATKVAELRKVHQQSVRDGKNELLPAVLKALNATNRVEAVIAAAKLGIKT